MNPTNLAKGLVSGRRNPKLYRFTTAQSICEELPISEVCQNGWFARRSCCSQTAWPIRRASSRHDRFVCCKTCEENVDCPQRADGSRVQYDKDPGKEYMLAQML